jgi:hypothetical protein
MEPKPLPVHGGPLDGGEMPGWGPMMFRLQRERHAYWYEQHAHRWVLVSVTDLAAPHPGQPPVRS